MTYVYLQQAGLNSPIERVVATSDGLQEFYDKGWGLVSFGKWYDGLAADTKAAMSLNAPTGQYNDPSVAGQKISSSTGEPV